MAWEYQIVHYNGCNERAIKRFNEEEERRLDRHGRTRREEWARRFFHEDTARSALIVAKIKGKNLKEEQLYRPEQPKQSWGEFSSD